MNTYQVPVSVIGFRAVQINILFPAIQTHSTARRKAWKWAAKCPCMSDTLGIIRLSGGTDGRTCR